MSAPVIGHLQITYRVREHTARAQVTGVFDRLAQEELDSECARAFREVLRGDPAVYLVREVACEARVRPGEGATAFAGRWARLIARSGLDTAFDGGPGSLRFPDWPAYLARFLADVLRGEAAGRWYYEPLARHAGLPLSGTVESLLETEADHVPAVLAMLRTSGHLGTLLDRLDDAATRRLVRSLGCEPAVPLPAGGHPGLMLQAIAVAALLDAWRGPSQVSDAALQALGRAGLAAAGEPAVGAATDWVKSISVRFHAASPSRSGPWNAVTTTLRMLELLAFFEDESLVRPVSSSPGGASLADRESRLRDTVGMLNWADLSLLHPTLERLAGLSPVAGTDGGHVHGRETGLGSYPGPDGVAIAQAGKIASGQRALRAISDVLTQPVTGLDRSLVEAHAAATNILPTDERDLAALFVRWTRDLILLSRMSRDQSGFAGALRRGDGEAAVALLPAPTGQDRRTVHAWSIAAPRLEPEAWSGIRDALRAGMDAASSAGDPIPRLLRHAGLYLLVRPIMDLRLQSLTGQSGFPVRPDDASVFAFVIAGIAHDLVPVGGPADASTLQEELSVLAGERIPGIGAIRAWSSEVPATAWVAFRDALDDRLRALRIGLPDLPDAGAFKLATASVLRAFARWLPGLSGSSVDYLLTQFIDRPGTLVLAVDTLRVTLARRPLDAVLRMSGALDPVERVPWLGRRLELALAEDP